MTNDTGHGSKREVDVSDTPLSLQSAQKRARTEAVFHYSVHLTIDPAKEADFASWIQQTILKEAEAAEAVAEYLYFYQGKSPKDQSIGISLRKNPVVFDEIQHPG